MIIAIVGTPSAGKRSVLEYLVNRHGFRELRLAKSESKTTSETVSGLVSSEVSRFFVGQASIHGILTLQTDETASSLADLTLSEERAAALASQCWLTSETKLICADKPNVNSIPLTSHRQRHAVILRRLSFAAGPRHSLMACSLRYG